MTSNPESQSYEDLLQAAAQLHHNIGAVLQGRNREFISAMHHYNKCNRLRVQSLGFPSETSGREHEEMRSYIANLRQEYNDLQNVDPGDRSDQQPQQEVEGDVICFTQPCVVNESHQCHHLAEDYLSYTSAATLFNTALLQRQAGNRDKHAKLLCMALEVLARVSVSNASTDFLFSTILNNLGCVEYNLRCYANAAENFSFALNRLAKWRRGNSWLMLTFLRNKAFAEEKRAIPISPRKDMSTPAA